MKKFPLIEKKWHRGFRKIELLLDLRPGKSEKGDVTGNRNRFEIEHLRPYGIGKQIMLWALSTMAKGCTCTSQLALCRRTKDCLT